MPAALAFALAALITLIPANMSPILIFSVAGNSRQNLIITGVEGLWRQGFAPLGVLVFFSAIMAPVLYLAAVSYVSLGLILHRRFPLTDISFRLSGFLEAWNLLPVFAVACIVSVVKLRTLGTVSWEAGALWIFIASLLTMLAMQCFDKRCVENFLERTR